MKAFSLVVAAALMGFTATGYAKDDKDDKEGPTFFQLTSAGFVVSKTFTLPPKEDDDEDDDDKNSNPMGKDSDRVFFQIKDKSNEQMYRAVLGFPSQITSSSFQIFKYKDEEKGKSLTPLVAGPGYTDFFGEKGKYLAVIKGYVPDANSSIPYTFSISPVPEPETWAMLLAGLGFIGFQMRRRQQNHA